MNVDDVMPWIVVPLVLFFLIRSMIKRKKGGGSKHDRHYDNLHDNMHDDHDYDSGDSGGGDSDD
jgi:hypothetical protein